jgi:hypothetical protein
MTRSHLKNRILVQVLPPKIGGTRTRDRVSTRRHTKVFRGVGIRSQHRNLSASGGLGQKAFLRWLLFILCVFTRMIFAVPTTFFVLTLGTPILFIFQIFRVFAATLRHYFHLHNDGTNFIVFVQLDITRFPLLNVISISSLNKSMTNSYSEGRE